MRSGHPGRPDAEASLPRVACGDPAAFAELYDALSGSVHRVARRIVRDHGLAEDVTQDTFLEVWRKAPGFDPACGTARTWVLMIAHRRAVDAVRRNESHRRQDRQAVRDAVCHDQPADTLLEEEEHAAVRGCLGTLTPLQLESITLAYVHGHTYAEVAALLDKPLPTVKTRIRDGLIRLRDRLEDASGPAPVGRQASRSTAAAMRSSVAVNATRTWCPPAAP